MDALAYDASSLNRTAGDWAEWDDTYRFVEDLNEHYIKENLTNETFETIRVNMLLFLGTNKKIKYQQGFDFSEARMVEIEQNEIASLLKIPGLISHDHEKSFTAGIVVLPKGPMLVASRPILNSQHTGPMKGTMIMGRYLDQSEVEQLSKRVHAELFIRRIDSAASDHEFSRALAELSKEDKFSVFPISDSEIAGFGTIKDVSGDASLIVKVLMPRDITQHGAWTTIYLVFSLVLVTVGFGLVTLVVLEKMIVSRLLGLESELRLIGESGRTDLRVTENGSDEISKLANQVNEVLQSVETSKNELRNSLDTIQALLNASSDAAVLLESDGRFLAMNESTARALDSDMDSLIGCNPLDFFPKEVSELRRSKFDEAVRSGKPVSFEDSNKDRIFHHNFNPVIGSDGLVDKVAIFSRDITEEKKTQQLLIEATRLKAIGEMASGVAHNFNNILQLMIGTADTAELQLEQGRLVETMECLHKISSSAKLGAQTVKRLQDLARVQTPGKIAQGKVFDLSRTVEDALEMTVPVWKTNPSRQGIDISVETVLGRDCLMVGHENEIFEVIINLIKNAVEAMPSGGKIYVKTESAGTQIILEITDTGIGIDQADLPKVFMPFWSTKGFRGTGIGLASSHGIISSHGGEITVKSQKGSWTAFTIILPKAE